MSMQSPGRIPETVHQNSHLITITSPATPNSPGISPPVGQAFNELGNLPREATSFSIASLAKRSWTWISWKCSSLWDRIGAYLAKIFFGGSEKLLKSNETQPQPPLPGMATPSAPLPVPGLPARAEPTTQLDEFSVSDGSSASYRTAASSASSLSSRSASSYVSALSIPEEFYAEGDEIAPVRPPLVLAGIPNLGATCYMNASIQMLAAFPPFMAKLRQPIVELQTVADPAQRQKQEQIIKQLVIKLLNAHSQKAGEDEISAIRMELFEAGAAYDSTELQKMCNALVANLKKDQNDGNKEIIRLVIHTIYDGVAIVQREKIRQALVALIDARDAKSDRETLKGLAQQLRDVIFASKELAGDLREVNRQGGAVNSKRDQQEAAAFFELILGEVINFHHEVFVGRVSTDLRYLRGETKPQAIIQVAMKPGVTGFEQLVKENSESIEGSKDNTWTPVPGVTYDRYLEKNKIEDDLAGSLIIQLKRFGFDGINGIKNTAEVDFPDDDIVDVSKAFLSAEGPMKYALSSFVVHKDYSSTPGEAVSIKGGHYVTYAKESNGQWYCFDDSQVRSVSPEEANAAKRKAYIFHLEKVASGTTKP